MMPYKDEPVGKCFPLITEGRDAEIDAIGIIIEAMGSLHGEEIKRILAYLTARYTRQP